MRPERDNIAAPELPGRITWLNRDEPPSMAALTATGPVLVHVLDPLQLNCVRALPYIAEWNRRYASLGLTTLGIHSPRFAFTADSEVAGVAIERLGIEHAVALDHDYAIWHDYGAKGWPSLFLWGQGGALRWAHQGEGEYQATETAVQDELRLADVTTDLPPAVEALRATDAPGALVAVPTAEIFPGGSASEPWEPEPGGSQLVLDYAAGEAWVVAEGEGEIGVAVDEARGDPVRVAGPTLAQIAGAGPHEAHRVALDVPEGIRIWAISFAPGPAAG